MNNPARARPAVVAVVCLCLSACGPGGGASSLPDACSLVTADEVQSLLGAAVTGVRRAATLGPAAVDRCDWTYESTTPMADHELRVSVSGAGTYGGAGELPGSTPYAIGDEGVRLDTSRTLDVSWKRGSYAVDLRYVIQGAFSGDFEASRTRALEIAQAVDGRL